MTRMSKQGKRRAISPRKYRNPSPKTGPLKEAIPFRKWDNALTVDATGLRFIPKLTAKR